MPNIRIMNFIAGQSWAMLPESFTNLVDIAQREFEKGTLSAAIEEAVAGREGRPLNNTRTVENRDGVAVIPVNGVISRYATFFHDICGGTSTEILAKDFTTALDNPGVKAILFDVDSPGGASKGLHELGEMIYQARGKKPIKAYVGGEGCSAAYWIASACDEVIIDATATLGSVGTVGTITLRKSRDDVEVLEFVSSQSPNKRLDVKSEEGKAAIQTRLDELTDVFLERVARNRGMTTDAVINDFKQGGTLIGQNAVNAGMADRLGSLEGVVAELSGGRVTSQRHSAEQSTKTTEAAARSVQIENQGADDMPLTIKEGATASAVAEALKAQHPEAFEAISKGGYDEGHAAGKLEGITEGKTSETERVKSVFEQSMPGHEDLIKTLALDGSTTGEQAAVKVLAAERQASADFLSASSKDAPNDVTDVAEGQEKTKMSAKEIAKAATDVVEEEASKGRTISYSQAIKQVTGEG
ncbi:S49 family peptidase [Vibrio parahaemolyticus]|uniref:S49 family peptidase n=1 Tax=Vibrio parahaemolyticus TaxID=670 RepID=UPI001302901F|nr:S49 family peptidase [Vibrio parahaemolyticus]